MLRLIWCFWYLLLPAELFPGSIESLERHFLEALLSRLALYILCLLYAFRLCHIDSDTGCMQWLHIDSHLLTHVHVTTYHHYLEVPSL